MKTRAFWLSVTEVAPTRLKSYASEKRRNMTPDRVDEYNRAILSSGLLSPDGPFDLLDIHALTRSELMLVCD